MAQDEEVISNFYTYHRPYCHILRNVNPNQLMKLQSFLEACVGGLKPCGVCKPKFPEKLSGEVICNEYSGVYHELDCRTISNVAPYQLRKFVSWTEAVAKGKRPCGVCYPPFFELQEEEVIGVLYMYHRPHCPRLRFVRRSLLDRYPSWKEAEAKYMRACDLCCPSMILTKESAPPIEVPTTETTSFEAPMNEPTPEIEGSTTEAISQIIASIEESTPSIARPSKVPTPPIADPNQTVDVNQLTEWRRRVVRLVDKLEQKHQYPSGDSIAYRISRLKKDNVIPRHVEPSMRTVTEMRNIAEYESKTLSLIQSRAARAAWEAIEEWAQSQQIEY